MVEKHKGETMTKIFVTYSNTPNCIDTWKNVIQNYLKLDNIGD